MARRQQLRAWAHMIDERGQKFCCPRCLKRDYKILEVEAAPKGLFRFVAKCRCGLIIQYDKDL